MWYLLLESFVVTFMAIVITIITTLYHCIYYLQNRQIKMRDKLIDEYKEGIDLRYEISKGFWTPENVDKFNKLKIDRN